MKKRTVYNHTIELLHNKLILINRDNGNTSAVLFHINFTHILQYRYNLRPCSSVELKWVNNGSLSQFVYNISGLFSAIGQCVFVCLLVCTCGKWGGDCMCLNLSIYLSIGSNTPYTQIYYKDLHSIEST